MKAIIIVGLGFGDEGKGATVDFLTRQHDAEWVVRYCGGAQAGHNVQLPDGRRHTFSQFGSGTLAGAGTFLGPRMVISPSTLSPEARHLKQLGVTDPWSKLLVHPECLVSSCYHLWMNRLRELARGEQRHGSCGLGIGETRHYWLRYGGDAIEASDLLDERQLRKKLALVRDRFLIELQSLPTIDDETASLIYHTSAAQEAETIRSATESIRLRETWPDCETVILEGAQGVLLDEWRGFHPYTTWSTVTPMHAMESLAHRQVDETTVLGITRGYSTRHGAGPFPTHCKRMSQTMSDPGNPRNDWQGAIRFGPLDLVTLEYAARVADVDALVVNHLDELPNEITVCTTYDQFTRIPEPQRLTDQERITARLQTATPILRRCDQQELLDRIATVAPVIGTASGPTHLDRAWRKSMVTMEAPLV